MSDEKKPRGRPPTPGRRIFSEELAKLNINTVKELVLIATHADTPLAMKKDIFDGFLKYEYAATKEIHHKLTDADNPILSVLMELKERPTPPTAKKAPKKKPEEGGE